MNKSKSKARETLTNLGLLLAACFVFLFLFEVVVRLLFVNKEETPRKHSDRPTNWYLPIVSDSMRDTFYTQEKPADTFRIVVVGDSFTYGASMQFDDNFVKRLERMLRLNEGKTQVQVMNWGVPGFSTRQEQRLVSQALKKYQPDLIILQITLNDAELKAFHDTHSKFFKIRRFVNRSTLFKYWKSGKLIASKILFTLMNKEYLQYHLNLYSDSEKWKIFTNSLSEINTLCKEKQVPLLTVVFPMFTHAFDEKYPFKAVHTQINSFLESVNIANLDLLPFYEGIQPERLQASVGEDAHPNEIANRIAADAIYDKLSREKIVPDDLIVKRMRAKGRVPLHIYPFRDTINELNQVEEQPETEANNLEIAK